MQGLESHGLTSLTIVCYSAIDLFFMIMSHYCCFCIRDIKPKARLPCSVLVVINLSNPELPCTLNLLLPIWQWSGIRKSRNGFMLSWLHLHVPNLKTLFIRVEEASRPSLPVMAPLEWKQVPHSMPRSSLSLLYIYFIPGSLWLVFANWVVLCTAHSLSELDRSRQDPGDAHSHDCRMGLFLHAKACSSSGSVITCSLLRLKPPRKYFQENTMSLTGDIMNLTPFTPALFPNWSYHDNYSWSYFKIFFFSFSLLKVCFYVVLL